jgi:hypothetical protein
LPSGVYLFQIFDKSGGVNYVKKVLFIWVMFMLYSFIVS